LFFAHIFDKRGPIYGLLSHKTKMITSVHTYCQIHFMWTFSADCSLLTVALMLQCCVCLWRYVLWLNGAS